jgi:diaminobutyrate acetyltransferase
MEFNIMEIVTATEKDYLIFREISKQCEYLGVHTPYSYWVVCHCFGDSCFIIKEENKIIGTIMTVRNKDTLFVWQIGVLKGHRKKGYSQILYDSVLDYARKNGQTKISLSIAPENTASFNALASFCRRNGLTYKQIDFVNLQIPDENYSEYEQLIEIEIN